MMVELGRLAWVVSSFLKVVTYIFEKGIVSTVCYIYHCVHFLGVPFTWYFEFI